MESVREYFEKIERKLTSPYIASHEIKYDEKSRSVGIVSGKLVFVNGLILDFLELIKINEKVERSRYRFHLMDKNGMIFRYDNAPHHKEIKTFPHHKHIGLNRVVDSNEKSLMDVLKEIETLILKSD